MAATLPHNGTDCGAATSHSFNEPHRQPPHEERRCSEAADRQDARDRFTDEWKHMPRTRMKEQRTIIHDEYW